jgi:hypothetical protein
MNTPITHTHISILRTYTPSLQIQSTCLTLTTYHDFFLTCIASIRHYRTLSHTGSCLTTSLITDFRAFARGLKVVLPLPGRNFPAIELV